MVSTLVSLHILKLLENNGFGTIDTDLFWEDIPLDSNGKPKEGVWIVTTGSAVDRFVVTKESFDIYARYSNKLTSATKLESILHFLQTAYDTVCDLPTVPPYSTAEYFNVRIKPTSSIEQVGFDEQGRLVRLISGQIQFNK